MSVTDKCVTRKLARLEAIEIGMRNLLATTQHSLAALENLRHKVETLLDLGKDDAALHEIINAKAYLLLEAASSHVPFGAGGIDVLDT